MHIDDPLPFVKEFINQLDDGLSQGRDGPRLSMTQKAWLGLTTYQFSTTNYVNKLIKNLNIS